MKVCTKCLYEKELNCFSANSRKKDGLHTQCKECVSVKTAAAYIRNKENIRAGNRRYLEANKDKVYARQREYQAKNKDAVNARSKAWYEENKAYAHEQAKERIASDRAKHAEYVKAWTQRNKGVKSAAVAKRRSAKLRANAAWANISAIKEIYSDAEDFKLAGIRVEVDHIVPLISDTVCGLHTESNLRIILASHNKIKSNRVWPDQP